MSLLDSDADELRERAKAASSGRKTNQSGLGAFKGLSKYSQLTSKYRMTNKQSEDKQTATPVEHSRGTFSSPDIRKSVQSQGAPAPTSDINEIDKINSEVSAYMHPINQDQNDYKSVQSQSEDAPTYIETDFYETKALTVNESQCKIALTNIFDELPSVSEFIESQFNVALTLNTNSNSTIDSFDKSVQSQGAPAPTTKPTAYQKDNLDISAPLHPLSDNEEKQSTFNDARTFENEVLSASDIKVSAPVGAVAHPLKSKLGAESVQSRGEVGAIVSAKIRPLDSKDLIPLVSILTLSGSQRVILEFFFDQCVFNNSLFTPPITKEQLLAVTSLKEETALSSIKRLRSKMLIDRVEYKDGKAGWTKYKLAELTYKEILNFRNTKSPFAGELNFEAHNVRAKVGANVSANPSSKIDSNLNINTNLLGAPTLSAPTNAGWFKNLDFSPIKPISPIQVNPSIRNLVESKLSSDDVQNFINRFLPWLSTQSKVNNVIAIFCDKLKEFANEGDSPVLYVQTEAEIELEAEIALKAQKLTAHLKVIQEQKDSDVLAKINSEFESWYKGASDRELLDLQSPNQFVEFRSEIYKKTVKAEYLRRQK